MTHDDSDPRLPSEERPHADDGAYPAVPTPAGPEEDESDAAVGVEADDLAVSAYVDGVASPAEAARVEANPALLERAGRYRTVSALLADDWADEAIEPDAAGADPELFAALDRARENAMAAAPEVTTGDQTTLDRHTSVPLDPAAPPSRSPTRPGSAVAARSGRAGRPDRAGRPGRAGHRRSARSRWAVQVAGLAAAVLVAVGAVALLGSSDGDRSSSIETADAPSAEAEQAPPGGGGIDQSAPQAARQATEELASARADAASPAAGGQAGPTTTAPPAPAAVPVLGTFATVDELAARLDAAPPSSAPAAAAPAATTGGGPTSTSVPGSAGSAGSVASSGPGNSGASCAPPGGAVLGTATVAGRTLLVARVTGAGGQIRLVGYDPADCATVFDRPA